MSKTISRWLIAALLALIVQAILASQFGTKAPPFVLGVLAVLFRIILRGIDNASSFGGSSIALERSDYFAQMRRKEEAEFLVRDKAEDEKDK
jgi:hypothetical protein